jgi:putative oxidoreductase
MNKKGVKIIMWICISVLTIQFLLAGLGKLLGAWPVKFAAWGYSLTFMYTIGLLEILGTGGLFLSKTRKWSCILFTIIMAGAAYTHISSSEYLRIIHNLIIAGLSLLIIRLNQKLKIPD